MQKMEGLTLMPVCSLITYHTPFSPICKLIFLSTLSCVCKYENAHRENFQDLSIGETENPERDGN